MAGDGPVERSITFDRAELAAIQECLGTPLPLLGPDPGVSRARPVEPRAAVQAEELLRRRGVLVGDSRTLAPSVAAIFEIVAQPALTVDLVAGPVFQEPDIRVRLHATARAAIEQLADGAGQRFTPLATADILARVVERAGVTSRPASDGGAICASAGRFAEAWRAARSGGMGESAAIDRAARVLSRSDPLSAAAKTLAGELVNSRRVTLAVWLRRAAGRAEGAEFGWLDAPSGIWQLSLADALGPGDESEAELTATPVDAMALVQAIHAALPASP